MQDVLWTALDFIGAHPWVIAIVPVLLIWWQLTVGRKRNAWARRLENDRAAQRLARDLHEEAHRRASER
ncbi:hypothetical protein [Xylanimonas sp. McL0601]|uniref:hypothetical protein n=1 Tax=Xylanimonas sp. McL0601 TaxID=3414739 RepID=UPI003CF5663E